MSSYATTMKEIIPYIDVLQDKIGEFSKDKSMSERLGFYPLSNMPVHRSTYARFKQLEAAFWLAEEVNYSADREHFESLSFAEQELLKKVMAIFASGDGALCKSLLFRFLILPECKEDMFFYITQLHNEQVHAQVYGDMLIAVLDNHEEVMKYPDTNLSLQKVTTFLDNLSNSKDIKEMYVSNAIGEYLIFSSLFAVIFWFRHHRQGLMPGVVAANEQIAKDEGVHAKQSCDKYCALPDKDKYTQEEIEALFKPIVEMIKEFVHEMVGQIELIDLSPKNFKKYIEFVADDLLIELGHEKIFNKEDIECPLSFMTLQDLGIKSNFYEADVNSYSRFSMKQSLKLKESSSSADPIKSYEDIEF